MRNFFIFGLIGLAVIISGLAFAQEESTESITITTYYPAPFGVYNEMRANKMVIGDPDSSTTPAPDTDGVMIFKGSVSDPSGLNDQQDGALYYNDFDHKFKYYDSFAGEWKEPGGVGGIPSNTVIFYNGTSCPSGWTELTSARGRYLVGLPLSGTLAGTAGTALSNLENRPVGQHNHE